MQFYTVPSYADIVNGQFHKNESHYVSLDKRLNDSISAPWEQMVFDNSINDFMRNNPTIKKWSDMTFCRATETTLDKIEIDTTLQRKFDLRHACNILSRFKQILVMPICVYEEPARPGKFICWDGQHTALVLYTILSKILGEKIKNCTVPVVVYASSQKSEMRTNFIELNGDAKQPLDQIDIFHQKVFGVRTDKSTNSDWLLNEAKQTALEQAKMFATHRKFGDVDEPGALTVLTELTDCKNYDLSITQHFCKYFMYVCQSNRPVAPKESWMIYEYFRLCENVGIEVTDDYIQNVARSLRIAFDDNFDADVLFNRAKFSYQEWWRIHKPSPDGTLSGISYPEKRIGVTFLIKQIQKNFDGTIPRLRSPLWSVPKEDLF